MTLDKEINNFSLILAKEFPSLGAEPQAEDKQRLESLLNEVGLL